MDIFDKTTADGIYVEQSTDFFLEESPYLSIFENMSDGVCVLNTQLKIQFENKSMRKWYNSKAKNHECYKVYHQSDSPCEGCPALNTIKSKKPQQQTARYSINGVDKGWQQIYTVPVFEKSGEVCLVIEYVKDISFQKEMQAMAQDLESRLSELEKQNSLLITLMKQKDNYRLELEKTITSNIEQYVKPSLNYLKKTVNKTDIDMINNILDEVVSPSLKNRPTNIGMLTPRERQIAGLIKEGISSKEIATTLFITRKAVDFHRVNIRKKLNLKHGENLQVYLVNWFR